MKIQLMFWCAKRQTTYLIGSYSWPDCDIIALILSSSEALASARLAVCSIGNHVTHTLETHLSPPSQKTNTAHLIL